MPDIEEQIRRAFEEGKFDNLPGEGKPLDLDDDSNMDEEWRMAYHILKNGGFSLPWIQSRKDILAALNQMRSELQRTWNWMQGQDLEKTPPGVVEQEWQRAQEIFRGKVDQINCQIRDYNLLVPTAQFHLPLVNAEREISRLPLEA